MTAHDGQERAMGTAEQASAAPGRLVPAADGLDEAAALLRRGRLVAFPTETVYGLGANALDAQAAARVFAAKQRPRFDPLIVHLADLDALPTVASELPAAAAALARHFWPGPLTLVLPRSASVPPIVTSGLDTVAVRIPDHPVARALIERAGVPVAAPSANPFGRLSPTRAEHVTAGLGNAVDLVLDGGPTRYGIESTIVDARGTRPVVLRLGAISVEAIEAVTGPVELHGGGSAPSAPGQLPHHYAPRTPLRIIPRGDLPTGGDPGAACVVFRTPPPGDWAAVEVLARDGSDVTAAARLFDVLHQLDAASPREIVVEPAPDAGLGRAINDRLRRAAAASNPAPRSAP